MKEIIKISWNDDVPNLISTVSSLLLSYLFMDVHW